MLGIFAPNDEKILNYYYKFGDCVVYSMYSKAPIK